MSCLNFKVRYYQAHGPKTSWRHVETKLNVGPKRSAFVLVDVYGLGFSPEDGIPHPSPALVDWSIEQEREVTVGRIKPALDAARHAGLPIIYLSNSAPRIDLKDSEFNKLMKRVYNFDFTVDCGEDNVDPREYHHGDSAFLKHSKIIEPHPDDYFIRKLYYSGFCETRFDKLLRHLGVNTLFFVGYALDVCLHCTMTDALNANYEVVFLRDCSLTDIETLPGEQRGSVSYLDRMIIWHEMNVGYSTTSAEFIEACQSPAQTA